MRAQEQVEIAAQRFGRTCAGCARPFAERKFKQPRLLDAFSLELESLHLRAQQLNAGKPFHLLTRGTQRLHRALVPFVHGCTTSRELLGRQENAALGGEPGAEQHQIDVDAVALLHREAFISNAMRTIDPQRKAPEIVAGFSSSQGLFLLCALRPRALARPAARQAEIDVE